MNASPTTKEIGAKVEITLRLSSGREILFKIETEKFVPPLTKKELREITDWVSKSLKKKVKGV